MKDQEKINKQILIAERELAALDAKRKALQDRIIKLKSSNQTIADEQLPFDRLSGAKVTNESPQAQKIALFRSLFRGREDVYPRRFESKRTGKSGFQPVPVILTERVEHLEKLKSLLENEIENLIVMKGGMGKKQRQAALNALESLTDKAEKALLATGRYLGEGFDTERLDTLFLALPISWRGTLNQYAGRLHRIHESKKEVVIYDYVDSNLAILAKMYDRRLKGYRSIGYEIEDDQS